MKRESFNGTVRSVFRNLLKRREASLVILLLVFLIPVLIRSPKFLSVSNLALIFNDMSILTIVAIGQFFVILSNGIDLSVGSVIAFTGMAAGMINESFPGVPIPLILLTSAGIGMVMGMINGVLVAWGKIPPIITTLGTMSIYRGLTFVLSGGTWVTAHEMTPSYIGFPRIQFLGISILVWIAILVVIVMYCFIRYTRTGRAFYAIGGNPVAAKFVGVNEAKTRFIVFLMSGLLAGIAGGLWTARYASAVNEMATGFEMQTVAACVLGGVAFSGGAGGVPGVVLGALFLTMLNNALPVIYLSTFWQTFVEGLVLLAALVINTVVDQRKTAQLLAQRRVKK